jgi:hypothetical protein
VGDSGRSVGRGTDHAEAPRHEDAEAQSLEETLASPATGRERDRTTHQGRQRTRRRTSATADREKDQNTQPVSEAPPRLTGAFALSLFGLRPFAFYGHSVSS